MAVAVLTSFFAVGPAPVRAQAGALAFGRYRVDVWHAGDGRPEGLPANNVNFLAQSADGYLWLATPAGLTRFDGLRFQLVSEAQAPVLGQRLSYLEWPLLLDREGRLWITTDRGLVGYEHGAFTAAPEDTTFRGEAVQQLAEDASGHLYGVTVRGTVFAVEEGRFRPIPLTGVPTGDGFGILADPDGTLWIARDEAGLIRYQAGVANRVTDGPLGGARVTSVFRSRDAALWIGTRRGAIRRFGRTVIEVPFWGGDAVAPVVGIDQAPDGSIWFATDGAGVVRVSGNGSDYRVERFAHDDGLTDGRAISVLADDEGDVWVGTRLGLNRFHPVLFESMTVRDGLPSDAMGAMLRDRGGDLWVAPVEGGLFRGRRGAGGRATFATVTPRDMGRATALGVGRDGTVWAGWRRGELTGYREGGVVRVGSRDGLAPGPVYAVMQDREGRLWVGTGGGLTRFVMGPDGRPRFDRTFASGDGLREDVAMRLWEDDAGGVWVGNAGLSRIVGDSVTTYGVRNGLSAPFVTAIHAEPDGTLWVGTHGGLTRVRDGRLVAIHRDDGLSDAYIDAIQEDDRGNLWLSGAEGLTRVSLRDLDAVADSLALGRYARLSTAESFGVEDGLPGQDAVLDASPGAFADGDGRLWFAMAWGVAIVDPAAVTRHDPVPRPLIEEVLIDGRRAKIDSVLMVPPGARSIDVRYTGIGLRDGADVRFRYRFERLDTGWVDVGTRRVATLTRPPPGTYRFWVQARSGTGLWSLSSANLTLHVRPLFYRTWWFVGLAALATGVAGGVVARARRRRREERLEAVIEERTRIARELHDTLLQGFTGVSLHLVAVAGRIRALPEAHGALQRVILMAQRTLVDARQAVWAFRTSAEARDDLAATLHAVATEALSGVDVAYECSVRGRPRGLPPVIVTVVIRVAQESLVNVARHARARSATITLEYLPREVHLAICDDGVGFDPSPEHAPAGHWGLVGMRERAEALDGALDVRSRPGKGTEIHLSVPCPPGGPPPSVTA